MKVFLIFLAFFVACTLGAPINTVPYQSYQQPELGFADVWQVPQQNMRYPGAIIKGEQQALGVPYTPAYILSKDIEQVSPLSQYYADLPVQTPYMPVPTREVIRQRMMVEGPMPYMTEHQQRIFDRLTPIDKIAFLQQLQAMQLGEVGIENNMEDVYTSPQFQTLDANVDFNDLSNMDELLKYNLVNTNDNTDKFDVSQWRGGRGGFGGRGGWGGMGGYGYGYPGYGGYGYGNPGYGGYGEYGYPGSGYGGYGGYGYPGYGYGGFGGWGRGGGFGGYGRGGGGRHREF